MRDERIRAIFRLLFFFYLPAGRFALLDVLTGLRFTLVLRRLMLRYPHATCLHCKTKREQNRARDAARR